MDLETRLARVEANNKRLKVIAYAAAITAIGAILVQPNGFRAVVAAQESKEVTAKPGPLKATRLVLVDGKGVDRVALAVDNSGGPNEAVFSVFDMQGKKLAQIGDTNDAGPAIEFFADGKRTAVYSYMNLSLRAPKTNIDRLYLGLPISGDVVSPSLNFMSKSGHQVVNLTATDDNGGAIRLLDKDGKLIFEKP